MGRINWVQALGWGEEHLEDLRYTGYSYIRQGKYEIALPFFEALSVLSPDNTYDAQTLGALYLQLKDPKKAIFCLDKALKTEGDHAPTLLNLTKAFLMLGKREEALKLAKILQNELTPSIAGVAKALILAYS